MQLPSGPPSARSVAANTPGLGPGHRRCNSCRADQFQNAAVAEHMRHPSSKRNDAGGIPAGSAIARWCQVARRPVKPLVLVRVQVWQPNLRKAGRYKLAAPVSKTGSAQTRGGRATHAFRHLNLNERKPHEKRPSLSKSTSLAQKLQTTPCHPNSAGAAAEYRVSPLNRFGAKPQLTIVS